MLYLTQTLFVPWLLAALVLGLLVGWWSTRRMPHRPGLGWLAAGGALFVIALFVAGTLAVPGRLGLWFDTALHFLFWYLVGCCAGSLVAFLGIRDDRSEPVAAWARPIPSEGGAAAPATPGMPDWIRVSPQAGATDAASVPALQAARDWLEVLRRSGPGDAGRVPDWVRPILPPSAKRPAARKPAPAPEIQARPIPATKPIPDWVRPILPSAARDDSSPWQAVRAANGVTITGPVADEAMRARMMMAARKALAPLTVTDRLSNGAASARLETMAQAAFGHLARLDRGIASVADGRYTLTGVARDANDRQPLIASAGELPGGFTLDRVEIAAPANRSDAGQEAFEGERPTGLEGPRDGRGDDLKRIRGIGPQNEGRLHGLGIWHFDQVAAWTADNALWVGSYLAFPGRIEREDWIGQAKLLASGQQTEFSKRVDKGRVATSRDDGTQGAGNVEKIAPLRSVEGAPPKERGRKPKA